MSKIKTKLLDATTGQPMGYGVSATIVKAGDKKGIQLGGGFISDDNSILEIDSKLLDYTKDADAVDIIVETKGYTPQRVSPEEFAMQDLKLKPVASILKKTKERLKAVPPWAWEAGGITLFAAFVFVVVWKKVK